MKQTGVDYLVNELKKSKHFQRIINEISENKTIVQDIILQAKQLEQEQIKKAYNDALSQTPGIGSLQDRLFELANDFAVAKQGDVAVKLHIIRNELRDR